MDYRASVNVSLRRGGEGECSEDACELHVKELIDGELGWVDMGNRLRLGSDARRRRNGEGIRENVLDG
jgi:hypothetical protein